MITFSLLPRLCTSRNARRFGLLALKLAFFLPLPLCAQSRSVYSVDIPFAFTAGSHELPAGKYTVARVFEGHYRFLRPDGTAAGSMIVNPAIADQRSGSGKLVFHHYGEHYFLSSFWMAGSRNGFELPAGKEEKELAKARAQSDPMVALNVGAPQE